MEAPSSHAIAWSEKDWLTALRAIRFLRIKEWAREHLATKDNMKHALNSVVCGKCMSNNQLINFEHNHIDCTRTP